MQNPLSYYMIIVKRWYWMVLLGLVLCGGAAYVVSKQIHPSYQASANLILNECTSQTTPYDCTTAGIEALPTYAQLITSSAVLESVAAHYQAMTVNQLSAMITVKPQSNTLLIEVDVTNKDPQLATDLANQVSQSFAQYSNTQLPGHVQVIPAQVPLNPVGVKPLIAGAIGAFVGLGLAIALIIIFEWIDDRARSLEEVQEILGMETLTVIPRLSRRQRKKSFQEIPALVEGCRMLSASLNAAQSIKPFKLVMVTSALAGEGKSTIAADLALFLAISGKRVLLVDANLRDPTLHKHFQLDNYEGLAWVFSLMMEQVEVEVQGKETEIPSLNVLTAGSVIGSSVDFLQSSLARELFEDLKKTDFDYVIIDSPPLLPVADAQILALYVQAIILVVDVSKTPRKLLLRAKKILGRTHSRVLGVALNKSVWHEPDEIGQYLGRVQQHQGDSIAIVPPSPKLPGDELTKIHPKTSPVHQANGISGHGMVDPNVTVRVYPKSQDEDE
jgi:polysaccharide biosynthesis transport protein